MASDKIVVIAIMLVSISSVLQEERLYFVGFEVLTAVVMKSSVFWDVASCLTYSSTLKMEATYSSETSVDVQ
jgi:hypothetical protein